MSSTIENSLFVERKDGSIVYYLHISGRRKETILQLHPKGQKFLVSAPAGSERAEMYGKLLGSPVSSRGKMDYHINETAYGHTNFRWIVTNEEASWLFSWELSRLKEYKDKRGIDYILPPSTCYRVSSSPRGLEVIKNEIYEV